MTELYNVAFLENQDFDGKDISMNMIRSKGKNSFGFDKNKHTKILVMVQANFCGYCTNAKPAFQDLAYEDNDIFCSTILGDGSRESEKSLRKRLPDIYPDFKGFPHYCLHDNTGKRIKKNVNSGRSFKALKKFCSE